ncbi:hypothetical protein AK830_g396 [Neonectria ditissima]|uniref:Uncharacterized protein n=1 Tax=Neonectria ditissima TaxID=78410 RepID=A0A0P7BQ54_9HYPO|nr:hypothetical protein AK830_g396 [Neonectria ditissima]
MASTTVTYGKKRSLLRSLGSRRRQKHMAESVHPPNKKQDAALSTVTDSVPSEGAKRLPRKRHNRHASSIDEMASRLLDDSTLTLRDQYGNRLPGEDFDEKQSPLAAKSCKTTVESRVRPATPRKVPPRLERSITSPDSRARTARVEKHSPKSSGRTLRQNASTRSRADSSQKRKESGLQRPLPQSKTLGLDPLKSHPTAGLQASTSVPLRDVDGNVRCQRAGGLGVSAAIEPADPEEINQKLQAMLDATNALKPSTPQVANSSASKLTRMVSSKMFAKVSHAWDRLQSKNSFENEKGRGKIGVQVNEDDELARTPLPSPTAMSPISTIEIRLNEGDNLNKKKVQRIVGGQVARKPVADDGKSLRSGKSMEDPFAEYGGSRTPTTFESRLKMEAGNDSDSIPPVPRNPFDSEKGFDNDIEDRILSTPPVGSSTPRIRVEKISTFSPDESPTMRNLRYSQSLADSLLGGVTLGLGREGLMQARPLELIAMKASERKLVDPVARTRNDLIEMGPDTDRGMSNRGVKKHPSPSKEALEDLEMAFRKYTKLKISGVNANEVDELASSFISITPPSLTPRDKNRLISNRLSASNIQDLVSPSTRRGHHRHLSSSPAVPVYRIPHAVESIRKLHGEIRLVPPYRPVGIEGDDVDELH